MRIDETAIVWLWKVNVCERKTDSTYPTTSLAIFLREPHLPRD